MISFDDFQANCARVRKRVEEACNQAKRPLAEVSILPVTKFHPLAAVEFAKRAGFDRVGENRVQEAVDKQTESALDIRWDLIGQLQSNKAKMAAEHFDRIQSVDRLKLLAKLNQAAEAAGKSLAVLLQVNAGDDPAKAGVSCEEADRLLEAALAMPA